MVDFMNPIAGKAGIGKAIVAVIIAVGLVLVIGAAAATRGASTSSASKTTVPTSSTGRQAAVYSESFEITEVNTTGASIPLNDSFASMLVSGQLILHVFNPTVYAVGQSLQFEINYQQQTLFAESANVSSITTNSITLTLGSNHLGGMSTDPGWYQSVYTGSLFNNTIIGTNGGSTTPSGCFAYRGCYNLEYHQAATLMVSPTFHPQVDTFVIMQVK
ncbi:MAG: hypothetical protein JRN20_02335 [Nitrososphaerota archaeon]|jgi:hypothetical protein|nr:hypothetical protein [Nitrososphaerota archaeon]